MKEKPWVYNLARCISLKCLDEKHLMGLDLFSTVFTISVLSESLYQVKCSAVFDDGTSLPVRDTNYNR